MLTTFVLQNTPKTTTTKRQLTKWEKTFENHIFNKVLISRILKKKLLVVNKKRQMTKF